MILPFTFHPASSTRNPLKAKAGLPPKQQWESGFYVFSDP
ncbi:hypothetical protein HMPREF0322_02112 [Desulfitobacterium hafniense DP7]|uniref:Uncharacterized protein n=1 Tax=Desulfitobacterium hafniense DP7 TaxID=537010 RepID=G9XMC6_DESHA|nr:hypothetical protein HMPREF0322_02112 [Desulfitobacterium hafniense DP7]